MYVTPCCSGGLPRTAGWPLIWAALVVAGAVLGAALLYTAGVRPSYGAVLVGAAGLIGGAILNRHARVRGLPSAAAGIMAFAVYVAATLETSTAATAGGPVFVALLVSVTARSTRIGLLATSILATSVLLAGLI